MKIAFTSTDVTWESMMDPRFGRTAYILLYDDEKNQLTGYDNTAVKNEIHGAGPRTAQKLFNLNPDILITGNGPGENAATILKRMKLKIYIGAGEMSVKEAFSAYQNGTLKEQEL